MPRGRTVGARQRARFLQQLALNASVSGAAGVASVGRRTVYRWRTADDAFRVLWDEAIDTAIDRLEAEAWRRAHDGMEEYITCKGGLVIGGDGRPVMQRRYSDTMMALLLKAHRPERFRERSSVDLNVAGDLAGAIEEARKRARATPTTKDRRRLAAHP